MAKDSWKCKEVSGSSVSVLSDSIPPLIYKIILVPGIFPASDLCLCLKLNNVEIMTDTMQKGLSMDLLAGEGGKIWVCPNAGFRKKEKQEK